MCEISYKEMNDEFFYAMETSCNTAELYSIYRDFDSAYCGGAILPRYWIDEEV